MALHAACWLHFRTTLLLLIPPVSDQGETVSDLDLGDGLAFKTETSAKKSKITSRALHGLSHEPLADATVVDDPPLLVAALLKG